MPDEPLEARDHPDVSAGEAAARAAAPRSPAPSTGATPGRLLPVPGPQDSFYPPVPSRALLLALLAVAVLLAIVVTVFALTL